MAVRLPELASVYWRALADERTLHRAERLWTLTTVGHVVPFVFVAVALVLLQPLALPVSLIAAAHAWVIPELYAQRGANVLRPRARREPAAERRAAGLLGDLVGHSARALHEASGVVLERASLGVWVIGEAGALLVRPGGRRVHCLCVRVPDGSLPSGDRIAHLLLALRADERGLLTVANRAFAGAPWRVRRRISSSMRPALDAAIAAARDR